MADTAIEWTDKVWNPVTGCTKVSQGCKNCYAERVFPRAYGTGRKFTDIVCHEDRLAAPLHYRTPCRIFVNSMSDLFHEAAPEGFIDRVFAVMATCQRHTFQVLTKRPERMLKYTSDTSRRGKGLGHDLIMRIADMIDRAPTEILRLWPLPNVWLGVSCEDQKTADERIPLLLQTPAAVRWISAEPLLGPIDLHRGGFTLVEPVKSPSGTKWPGLDWVVCGGESGPYARPMYSEWARSLRDQCVAASVPYFFKQYGEWVDAGHPLFSRLPKRRLCYVDSYGRVLNPPPTSEDADCVTMKCVGKKAAGRLLDGRLWNEYPKVSESNLVSR